jgi:nicotinamide-nucleotide amidase
MEIFEKAVLERIRKKLLKNKVRVAVAESVTGGLIQFSFSNMPDASQFFQGGICAYNLGQKYKHLNVEPIHAEQVSSVSPQVAQQMAINVAEMFNSNYGIGVTGFATPVPESNNKIYAFYSITKNGREIGKGKISIRKAEATLAQQIFTNKILSTFSKILDK